MKDINSKREREKEVVELMIQIYCKGKKHSKHGKVCEECQKLLAYSKKRTDCCPFMETKTFCSNCKVHCYKPDMKVQMKAVMRYSGPRMLFHHPIMAIHHVILEKIDLIKARNK